MSSAFLLVASAWILLAQGPPVHEDTPREVNNACGRLDYAKRIKVGDNAYTYSERRPLKAVALELYKAKDGIPCCANLELIGAADSNKRGRFKFRGAAPGPYWVKGEWNGTVFRVPIIFRPEKQFATDCSQQGILVDDEGNVEWWLSVSVD